MSTFEVPILRIDDVYDHPNADRLSILRIRGYEAITNKDENGAHRYAAGEVVIYVPEGAVVPERHLKERGYWDEKNGKGMLAGSQGNRVKAIKLRNVLSQGLVWKLGATPQGTPIASYGYPALSDDNARTKVQVGDNVADFFGIVKYEEPIPTSMSGKVVSEIAARFDYDIENLKNYPDFFQDGEQVVVTEKLHGTFCRVSHIPSLSPRSDLFGDGRVAIASKGLGARGLVFTNENVGGNVYVRALTPEKIAEFQAWADRTFAGRSVHIMGEVFGRGIQDLAYGEQTPAFRVFDIYVDGLGFVDDDGLKPTILEALDLPRVPVLYRGPYDRATIDSFVSGQTTIGKGDNIREGIVITAAGAQTARQTSLGSRLRPILKHVSEAYLTRKGGTELQ